MLWSTKPTLLAHYHEMKWNDSRNVNSTALEDCLDDKRTISKCFMEGAMFFWFCCNISGRGSPNRDWVATGIRHTDCQINCLHLCPVCLCFCLCLTSSKNRIITSFHNTVTLLRFFIMPGLRIKIRGGAVRGEQLQFDSSCSPPSLFVLSCLTWDANQLHLGFF